MKINYFRRKKKLVNILGDYLDTTSATRKTIKKNYKGTHVRTWLYSFRNICNNEKLFKT